MQFTYKAYSNMIELLREKGYIFSNYHNCVDVNKPVILRHDIDYSLEKALKLAKLEYELRVSSTYFVMLTTKFYNLMSRDNLKIVDKIKEYGHDIGLHFDEVNYPEYYYDTHGGVRDVIFQEARLFKQITGIDVKSVSMHRPSQKTLNSDYDLSPMMNSYSKYFFDEFKYISDSRRRWREDIEGIINAGEYNKLHILTHAFWYNIEEIGIKDSIKEFIENANAERFYILSENISDLESIISMREIK